MKRILSFIAVMLLALTLIACKKTEDDPAQAKLDQVHEGLDALIEDPSSITAGFELPGTFQHGVTGTWVSSEPGVLSIATTPNASGRYNVTVNRPPKGSGNTEVTLSIELKIDAENSDDELTKLWSKKLTIIESATEDLNIETIADILALADDAYDPSDNADKVSVSLAEVTVFAKGDVAFVYDGTGIIQVYGGAASSLEVGKVYQISGLLEWYFGIWEIINSTAQEVTGATPKIPEKEVVTDISQQILDMNAAGLWESAAGTAKDGNMEPIYATVTGVVHVRPDLNPTDNYNTYIVGTDVDTETWKPGELGKPANGFMFYYGTDDLAYVRTFNGFEVTMDVVIYTYRSNNHAYAAYYVGGPEGIEIGELTDEQAVDLDLASMSLPIEVLKSGEKALDFVTETENDTTITWSLVNSAHSTLVDVATGDVTIPAEGQEKVEIKVTVARGDVTKDKTLTVYVGAVQTFTLLEAKDIVSGRTIRVQGVVTGMSANNTVTIQDETAAIALFGQKVSDFEEAELGDLITVVGKKTQFSGLQQIDRNYVIEKVEAGTMPTPVDLNELDKLDNDTLLPHQSKLVSFENAKVATFSLDDYGNVTMTLERLDGEKVTFRWDSRVEFEGSDFLTELEVGDFVTLEGAHLAWSNGAQISVDDAAQIKAAVVTDEILVATAKDALEIETDFETAGDLDLPATLNTVTITWALKEATDNDVVDLEEGKVTLDAEGFRQVVLVATLTKGEVTDTVEFTLNVGIPEEEVVTAEYVAGSGTTNMEEGNNASTLGLDDTIFTVTSTERVNNPLHVGLNNSGQIRLYGSSDTNGNILTISVVEGYSIKEIKINFGSNVAPTLINAGDSELFNDTPTADSVETFIVNGSEFSIKNINTSTGQLYILSIEITYEKL